MLLPAYLPAPRLQDNARIGIQHTADPSTGSTSPPLCQSMTERFACLQRCDVYKIFTDQLLLMLVIWVRSTCVIFVHKALPLSVMKVTLHVSQCASQGIDIMSWCCMQFHTEY